MPTVHETVYPRLKSAPSRRELIDLYTPTEGELELAERSSKGEPARLAFLVLLKTFQRLGYFVALRGRAPLVISDADYNVAPTTFQPVIRNDKETGDRELAPMR